MGNDNPVLEISNHPVIKWGSAVLFRNHSSVIKMIQLFFSSDGYVGKSD